MKDGGRDAHCRVRKSEGSVGAWNEMPRHYSTFRCLPYAMMPMYEGRHSLRGLVGKDEKTEMKRDEGCRHSILTHIAMAIHLDRRLTDYVPESECQSVTRSLHRSCLVFPLNHQTNMMLTEEKIAACCKLAPMIPKERCSW